jgi:hypothetical protein
MPPEPADNGLMGGILPVANRFVNIFIVEFIKNKTSRRGSDREFYTLGGFCGK